METKEYNQEDSEKQNIKTTIDFYIQHLSIKELIVLESVAKKLTEQYSESYFNLK